MLKKLAPKFVHNIDTWLLENHPVIWMSRVHYALWFGLLLGALSAAVGFGVYVNILQEFGFTLWYFIFGLIGFVFFCIWVYNYVIFNKDKSYGHRKPFESYLNFLLVFVCIAVFALVPVPFQYTCNLSIANTFTDDEITEHINILNEDSPYMLLACSNYESWRDTTYDITYVNVHRLSEYPDNFLPHSLNENNFKNYHKFIQSKEVVKRYNPDISEKELLHKINRYLDVTAKYGLSPDLPAEYYAKNFIKLRSHPKLDCDLIDSPINEYRLQRGIQNVCEAKINDRLIFETGFWIIQFYIVFVLSVLISLFKITQWKHYLLTAVIMIFYPIIVLILSELLPIHGGSSRQLFFFNLVFLFLLFSAYSIYKNYKNNLFYRPFYNCFNQVFYIALSFMPVLLVLYLHEYSNLFHNKDYFQWVSDFEMETNRIKPSLQELYINRLNQYFYYYWRQQYQIWVWASLCFGLFLFFALLPFLNRLFVKQLALPKKK
ncbi:MAG: hypothetical protein IT236_07525 [Bacteroidia bacterium]|nr:hypothetical protein [Bacteroidia bacterium]